MGGARARCAARPFGWSERMNRVHLGSDRNLPFSSHLPPESPPSHPLKSRAAEAGSPSPPGHNHQLPKSKLKQVRKNPTKSPEPFPPLGLHGFMKHLYWNIVEVSCFGAQFINYSAFLLNGRLQGILSLALVPRTVFGADGGDVRPPRSIC